MNEKWTCVCGETAVGNTCKACGSAYNSKENAAAANVKREVTDFLRSPLVLVLALLFGLYALSFLTSAVFTLKLVGINLYGFLAASGELVMCAIFAVPFAALLTSHLYEGKGLNVLAKSVFIYRIAAIVLSIIALLVAFGSYGFVVSALDSVMLENGVSLWKTLENAWSETAIGSLVGLASIVNAIVTLAIACLPVIIQFVMSAFEELPNNIIFRLKNPGCSVKFFNTSPLKRIVIFLLVLVIANAAVGLLGSLTYLIYDNVFELLGNLPKWLYFITTILVAIIEFVLMIVLLLCSALSMSTLIVFSFMLALSPIIVLWVIISARYVYTEYQIANINKVSR